MRAEEKEVVTEGWATRSAHCSRWEVDRAAMEVRAEWSQELARFSSVWGQVQLRPVTM